jgi:hypothetical protein
MGWRDTSSVATPVPGQNVPCLRCPAQRRSDRLRPLNQERTGIPSLSVSAAESGQPAHVMAVAISARFGQCCHNYNIYLRGIFRLRLSLSVGQVCRQADVDFC